MQLLHSNDTSPLLCRIQNAALNARETAKEIRTAYNAAGPVLAVALLPLIADAEKLRRQLETLADATRREGK